MTAFGPIGVGLTPTDLAVGYPVGLDFGFAALQPADHGPSPIEALEQVLVAALARPPCVVSFSGGRDSSAMLALATRVARREGLPDPIPVTLRFPESSETDEAVWQEAVMERLGLKDWHKITLTNELDVMGPIAREALRTHGLLWPFNTHMHVPIMDLAVGGTVITGFGGDELGDASQTALAAQALARTRKLWPRDALVVGLALSPRPLRYAVYRRRASKTAFEWLSVNGKQEFARAVGRETAAMSYRWDRLLLEWIPRSRYFQTCQLSFARLGAERDVNVVHPFVSSPVLRALAEHGGSAGFGSRTALLRTVFGELLPARVATRATKATFDDVLWSDIAQRAAREWSGEGLPPDLFDVDRLRGHWSRESIDFRSTLLLQAGWLHDVS